ncbi:uncharacterized protein LOC130675812 [Microplitis mediator]|uniref:uncharacterized protein LOC130675812 n=1 Tax=Microplitis mediator TaxID=375433 RepID=UPI002553D425|nr:uncharacterized protein LOC130675812 [Microplitis mediator]
MFVDDLSVACWGKNLQVTYHIVQEALKKLQLWADSNGFKFSTAKSEYMIISRSHDTRNNNLQLVLNDQPLKKKDTIKILGLTFDRRLTWKKHIELLKRECHTRLRIIKALSSKQWGSSTKALLRIYRSVIRSKLDYGAIVYDSANKFLLQTLQTIPNTACRLCLGAFKTSPTNSLLIEAGELPLNIRRMELCLKYTAAISSTPNNPAYHSATKQLMSNKYQECTTPKPLRIRTPLYSEELGITLPSLFTRSLGSIPPWQSQNIRINFELSQHDRPSTTPETYRALFCELHEKNSPNIEYYTDGSVMTGRAGFAVTTDSNVLLAHRVHDCTNIFSCEAQAVLHALELIDTREDNTSSTVYSDSMSCLSAIDNQFSTNPIIQNIQHMLQQLVSNNKTVNLMWIPAHQGIQGNELADHSAKTATSNERQLATRITLSEGYKYIHESVKQYWNSKWLQAPRSKLHDVRNNIWETAPTFKRSEQCVINRIRIGHTRLSHLHLIAKDPVSLCQRCNTPITVKHMLIECTKYQDDKVRTGLTKDMPSMLNDHAECLRLIKFLKEVNLFNSI